jgi:hypothetical protein
MKKNLFASLSLITLISIVASVAFMVKSAGAAPSVDLSHLPAGVVVPAQLPASIQDAELMEAWLRLYAHQDPVRLWDGRTLTGRGLAEFLRDHAIPVVWDTDGVCGGGSCSQKTCAAGQDVCSYASDQPGAAPIYIRPSEHGQMAALVDTLAHEIFHRTQPFGAVRDTRYEEYWAFRVENSLNPEAWLVMGAYDPLDSNHLAMWLRENHMEQYFQLPAYPASVAAQVAAPAQHTGGAFEGLPAAALGNGQ